MPRKPSRETPVERIYREVTGQKMPDSIKRILLRKPKIKANAYEIQPQEDRISN
jgi:hypothetical protein